MQAIGGIVNSGPGTLGDVLRKLRAIVGSVVINLIFVGLAALGAVLIFVMFGEYRGGIATTGKAAGLIFFGLLLLVLGLGLLYATNIGAPGFLMRLERSRERYRQEPWMERRMWRQRRIVHSTSYTVWFMWFWCLIWWGILGFIYHKNEKLILADLAGSWSQAIPAALPFVAGIIGVLAAISLSWRRYHSGDVVLLLETLPGFLGEQFRGHVEAPLKHRPRKAVSATLQCGSLRQDKVRNHEGSYETQWITDELWSHAEDIPTDNILHAKGKVSLQIKIDLPDNLPESGHVLDDPQIVWKLTIASNSILNPYLDSEFEVPVFARRDAHKSS